MERRKWKGMKRSTKEVDVEAEAGKEADDEAIDNRRRGCRRIWQKQIRNGR